MYSRQNRNGNEIAVELPRDYSGNAFSPFPPRREPPARASEIAHCGEKREECAPQKAEECSLCPPPECLPEECGHREGKPPILAGLGNIFGGNLGLEELLLLGVIFLIFTDEGLRDSELLICLLLILFI